MRVIWPMKSYEMWNKSEIILGCAEKNTEMQWGHIAIKKQRRPEPAPLINKTANKNNWLKIFLP